MRSMRALPLLLSLSLLLSPSLAFAEAAPEAVRINDLVARNQLEEAHEKALEWQEAKPENAEAAFWVGGTAGQLAMSSGMFSAMGYAKTSRKALESAVALDPENLRAQYMLMQFYVMAPGMMGGDKDEARKIAERIGQESPVEGLRAKGQLLASDKDMDGWLRENRAALSLEPAHPDALGGAVGYLLSKSDFAAAKALLDAAKAADATHPVVRYQFVKWAAMSGQELEPALAEVDSLIALPVYPDRFSLAGAQFRRGQLLARLGRKDEAIKAFEVVREIDEDMRGLDEEIEKLEEA